MERKLAALAAAYGAAVVGVARAVGMDVHETVEAAINDMIDPEEQRMEQKLFDKRFVHFMWDEQLRGRRCFVADNIGLLIYRVESRDEEHRAVVEEGASEGLPFLLKGEGYHAFARFAYYDPRYDERVALIDARKGTSK